MKLSLQASSTRKVVLLACLWRLRLSNFGKEATPPLIKKLAKLVVAVTFEVTHFIAAAGGAVAMLQQTKTRKLTVVFVGRDYGDSLSHYLQNCHQLLPTHKPRVRGALPN